MIYSKDGLHLTQQFESCATKAYLDSRGVATIGWGHTAGVYIGMTCTQDEADAWLQQDIQWAAGVVNRNVHIELTQNEFDALVDFVFNLGSGNFINSTLLRKLNDGDIEGASEEFEHWDMAGGVHVAGLLKRRNAERVMFDGEST
jgi:lysozyme